MDCIPPGWQLWLTNPNFACLYWGGCGWSGGGGDGSSNIITNIKEKIKTAYCAVTPTGSVTSATGTTGTVGGVTGSIDLVTNFDSGQVTLFRSGGGFVGLNGEWSGNVASGAVFGNLGNDNSNFGGYFTTVSGSYNWAGISVSAASGGYQHPLTLSKPVVVSGNVGASLFLKASATASVTKSIPIAQFGSIANGTAPTGSSLINYNKLGYLLRRPCHN